MTVITDMTQAVVGARMATRDLSPKCLNGKVGVVEAVYAGGRLAEVRLSMCATSDLAWGDHGTLSAEALDALKQRQGLLLRDVPVAALHAPAHRVPGRHAAEEWPSR